MSCLPGPQGCARPSRRRQHGLRPETRGTRCSQRGIRRSPLELRLVEGASSVRSVLRADSSRDTSLFLLPLKTRRVIRLACLLAESFYEDIEPSER